jgi:DNA-binding MarR family transcriptional regulator
MNLITKYLIASLLVGFEWFDESLQLSLRARGWSDLTRPESMTMTHIQMGIVRPSDIARSLRLTRQAVHVTIKSMVKKDLVELVDDPVDGRIRIVKLTATGEAMRKDAQAIVDALTAELARRIGGRQIKALREAFAQDWGEPLVVMEARPTKQAGHLRATARKVAPLTNLDSIPLQGGSD